MSELAQQHHYRNWRADYFTALPYLQEAFGRVIEQIELDIEERLRPIIIPVIVQLGNPDLSNRGYPRHLGKGAHYSLEPYVSRLTNMVKEVEVLARTKDKYNDNAPIEPKTFAGSPLAELGNYVEFKGTGNTGTKCLVLPSWRTVARIKGKD